MRAAVQRVSEAAVDVDGTICGSIPSGLLVYVGVAPDDGDDDVAYLVDKVRHLRIFCDDSDRMNLDVVQAGGQVLLVSAFTLQADARKGRRPSFDSAADPKHARALYEQLCDSLSETGVPVERGSFGAYMKVSCVNDGPICILLDSHRAI